MFVIDCIVLSVNYDVVMLVVFWGLVLREVEYDGDNEYEKEGFE